MITQRTTRATIDHAVASDALTMTKADAKTWWYVFTLGNILFSWHGFPIFEIKIPLLLSKAYNYLPVHTHTSNATRMI